MHQSDRAVLSAFRFPTIAAVRKQLQTMVSAHASNSSVQQLSPAFPWLTFGPQASLSDSALRFWAPAALLQVQPVLPLLQSFL